MGGVQMGGGRGARRRLEDKLKNLESENNVWRQKAITIAEFAARLEEKLTNLESENRILRQQAITIAQNNKLLEAHSRSIMQRTESTRNAELCSSPSVITRENSDTEGRAQKVLNEKQQENQDLLIRCIAQPLGFAKGRAIGACIIYKCLQHWRSLEAERTSIFDRLIQTISHAIEAKENKDALAYWLSNTSSLLLLLQRSIKSAGMAPQRSRSKATIFGRMTQSFRGIPPGVDITAVDADGENNGTVSGQHLTQIEATYPALLFKKQLTEYVEKIYGMIRDHLKREIAPHVGSCILAARKVSSFTANNPEADQTVLVLWKNIVQSLNNHLNVMKSNYVPSFLIRKLYTQTFSYINVHFFNSFLLRRECCSFSYAEYVKAWLDELENWCNEATEEFAGPAWDELKHVRQAIGFLVIHNKPQKTFYEVRYDLCPILSIQQLYRISTMYSDDKYGTHILSPNVISSMKVLLADQHYVCNSSFLLDDDSSIPFSEDDLEKSTEQMSITEIEPPPLIRDNPEFSFLLEN